MSPPTRSTASAISRAERSAVPLNSRCSRKCDTPASSAGSSRTPTPTQTPVATDRASGMRSVTTRRPDGQGGELDAGPGPARPQRLGRRRRRGRTTARPPDSLAAATRDCAAAAAAATTAAAAVGRRSRTRGRRGHRTRCGARRRTRPRTTRTRGRRRTRSAGASSRGAAPERAVADGRAAGRRRRHRRLSEGGSPAGAGCTLPLRSISSTRTSISSPRSSTSSTAVDPLAAAQLGDVDQAVTAREDVDERTELGDVDDAARVDLADARPSAGRR